MVAKPSVRRSSILDTNCRLAGYSTITWKMTVRSCTLQVREDVYGMQTGSTTAIRAAGVISCHSGGLMLLTERDH